MTKNEFLKICKDLGYKDSIEISWVLFDTFTENILENEFVTKIHSSEIEPEFDSLNAILEQVIPNITCLQYKRLVSYVVLSDLIKSSGCTVAKKVIYLDVLYNHLTETFPSLKGEADVK